MRDSNIVQLPISEVVVGDKILVQSGSKIPADGIVIRGSIKVDNSALNGEADECKKVAIPTDFVYDDEIKSEAITDKYSVFRGSVVTDGEAVVEIKRVGTSTLMGKMAEEMKESEPDSPLKVKLNKLAHQISVFGYVGSIVIALIVLIANVVTAGGIQEYFTSGFTSILQDVIDAISLAVTIIVCAVPEGLPLMIALVLMQNTGKLLDHNVLVRKAVGIETAGSLNILFSDKTGTITKGHLEVVSFFTGDGKVVDLPLCKSKEEVLNSIVKNTQSVFSVDHKVVDGNITDKALLSFVGESEAKELLENGVSAVASQDFNSTNKFSQVQLGARTYYKGAPEKFANAKKYLGADGEVRDIDWGILTKEIDGYSDKAMRILAFGYSDKPLTEDVINDDVVITGFVCIRDNVRDDAKLAIEELHQAGIQLIMITGDRESTARAIAKEAGLLTSPEDVVLPSSTLQQMSDEEIKELLPHIKVISRALPTDKSRMVRLAQELNLVVGMCGDGVNDSPALKKADVGFAMGSGTDVAKEAGDIIILDDSLKSIADAVLYGRTIYHNILKFCNFQLVINVCAVVVSALAPLFGVSEPLKVTHLLFVNLVMDGLGALMLGNEPAKDKYMLEKPRQRDESIINKSMASSILYEAGVLIALSFLYLKLPAIKGLFSNEAQHLTGYFVFFILSALFNGFNVRDEKFGIFSGLSENKNFIKIMCIIALIQAVIIYSGVVPFLRWFGEIFSCTSFSIINYVFIICLSAVIIPLDLIRKAISK